MSQPPPARAMAQTALPAAPALAVSIQRVAVATTHADAQLHKLTPADHGLGDDPRLLLRAPRRRRPAPVKTSMRRASLVSALCSVTILSLTVNLAPQTHRSCLKTKGGSGTALTLGGHRSAHRPADHAPGEEIDDGRQLEPAFGCPDVGEVSDPFAVWSRRLERAVEHIRSDCGHLPLGWIGRQVTAPRTCYEIL
jgi:hypothetical protein